MRKELKLGAILASTCLAAFAVPAIAQEEADGDRAQEASGNEGDDALDLNVIVVTGSLGEGMRKQDASFAISTVSDGQIDQLAPKSTADLLKIVPGLWVESSGGESGANVFVRGFPSSGDAEFLTVQMDGSPIFPPPTLSFLENTTLFRLDETVARIEALRGGPNPVLSNGQTGVTVNILQKTGGPEFEGTVKLTANDAGMKRGDFFISGPIDDGLYFSVGGFYRSYSGIRDAEFEGERGGQISATLLKEFDGGEVMVYARRLNDKNTWLVPIPVNSTASGDISEFPGFDARYGTFHGNDTRLAQLEVGRNGETVTRDLADGRGPNIIQFGGRFDYEFSDGFAVKNRFSYLEGQADTRGLVGASAPQTLRSFLAGVDTNSVGGTFSLTSTGQALTDLNQQVLQAGWWSVDKDIYSFSNDLTINKELFVGNTLSVGVYFADYGSKDRWYLGNNQLLTAEHNGRRVDLVLNDGTQVTRNGFTGSPFFAVNAAFDGQTTAFYLLDEWQVNDKLRVDAGIRYEKYNVNGTNEGVDFGVDLDGDPSTLYNNGAAVLNGSFSTIKYKNDGISWTLGANYAFTDSFGIFGRLNSGQKYPQFNDLQFGTTNEQKIKQYELGVKGSSDLIDVFGTFFYNDFSGLPFTRFDNGNLVTIIGDSRALGVEIESVLKPVHNFKIGITGTWQDAEFQNFGANSGNRVARQPRIQARISPSYTIDLPNGKINLFGTATLVGSRFADPENLQPLSGYETFDAGIQLEFDNGLEFQISGDNITNRLALTEGNPQIIGAQSGTIFARPILGRSVKFSIAKSF